jgi:hypothetical protein
MLQIQFIVPVYDFYLPSNACFGTSTMWQDQLKNILNTYMPEMGESHESIELKKSEIEKLRSQIRQLESQGQLPDWTKTDLKMLKKIHEYYRAMFAVRFTKKPLEYFHKTYCQDSQDIWCLSALKQMDSDSDTATDPDLGYLPKTRPSVSAQNSTDIPSDTPGPIQEHTLDLPEAQPKQMEPETSAQLNWGETSSMHTETVSNPEKTSDEVTQPVITRNQIRSIENTVTNFKQLVIDALNGKNIDLEKMKSTFPNYTIKSPFDLKRDIGDLVVQINIKITQYQQFNLNYDLYYMFGQFRKSNKQYDDYLENISIAHIYADICGKIKVLNELNTLKKMVVQKRFQVGPHSLNALNNAGLRQHWNEDTLLMGTNVCYCP